MTAESAEKTVLDFGEDTYQKHPNLERNLGEAVVCSLAARPGEVIIVDHTHGRKSMKAAVFLALCASMAKKIKREIPEKRVGIVLPPGLGGWIANVSIVMADKVPVNLNFSLGESAIRSCIRKSGLNTILTAKQVQDKIDSQIPGFPWTDSLWDMREEILGLPKAATLSWVAACYVFPGKRLARMMGVSADGGDREAGLLFTSGSDGDPKGVVLTHRNILCNSRQVDECGALLRGEKLMANLPIFHSFGYTVSLWCALLTGINTVTLPSPLEFKRTAKVIEEEEVGILLGTPTFFRPYLKKIKADALKSLKIVIAGAEKTPEGFREEWEGKFKNSQYLEGYGLTETSPVVSVNVPDYAISSTGRSGPGTRNGSVGRLFDGMAARIQDPDTGEVLPIGRTGILALKGGNVFGGYLEDAERTQAVFKDGWFVTGDLARLDDEGFLFIEGRLSRFSKIGGEMVPHGVVETSIAKLLGLDDSETRTIAISARPDAAKGEALVLLTTVELSVDDVRGKLAAEGIANLWIPKLVKKVDAIPTLASGKLDLKGLKAIAESP